MSGAPVDVVAVVVTWNSARWLPRLLASLPSGFDGVDTWRLVVADNDSSDETVALVRSLAPDATVVQMGRNVGYAAAINAGAVAGGDGALLVLNPDLELRPGSVSGLLSSLEVPGTGISVPRIRDPDGSTQRSLRRDPTVLRALGESVLGGHRAGRHAALGEIVIAARAYDHPHTVDWATGAALLVSAECRYRLGPWDESFFLFSEETEYMQRARGSGFDVRFTPSAEVTHVGGESHVSPRLWSILMVNRARLFARTHGRLSAALFRFALALGEIPRALAGRPTSRAALDALVRPTRRPVEVQGP